MAIDLITAYESEINRLNISIQQREQLLDNEQLNDEQIKELLLDVGSRWMLNKDLQKMKDKRDRRQTSQAK